MKKLFAFVIALVMIAGQLTGLSALAENASDSTTHIRFNAEDGLSVEEYNRRKSEFINQMIAARSITPATFSLRSTVSGNTLSNEYIEFAVDSSTGRFTVGTVAGNPALSTDDNKVMLYGHSSPWSSYTTVRVNGESYIYGDNGFVVSPYFNSDANYSEAVFGNIHVQQVISIVENSSTHRDDIVEIKYIVTNTGNSTASLGLRVMMDTMLGSNDAAPFRVPGHGDLTIGVLYLPINIQSEGYVPYTGIRKFETLDQFYSFANKIRSNALYWKEGEYMLPNDAFLALSTCYEDYRIVVMCRRTNL